MKNILASRKAKIIIIICILGVIISMVLWLGKPKFVTQTVDNLVKVVVIFEPYYLGENRAVYITERSEIEQVYKLLIETTKLRIYKHPRHLESIQWDSDVAIRFEYRNGNNDEFFIKKNSGIIVRFLNTRGNSNDPGYIIGSNEELWKYILGASWCD